jgi:hypothetical protein
MSSLDAVLSYFNTQVMFGMRTVFRAGDWLVLKPRRTPYFVPALAAPSSCHASQCTTRMVESQMQNPSSRLSFPYSAHPKSPSNLGEETTPHPLISHHKHGTKPRNARPHAAQKKQRPDFGSIHSCELRSNHPQSSFACAKNDKLSGIVLVVIAPTCLAGSSRSFWYLCPHPQQLANLLAKSVHGIYDAIYRSLNTASVLTLSSSIESASTKYIQSY